MRRRPILPLLLAGVLALGALTLGNTAAQAQADGRSPFIPIKPTTTHKQGTMATQKSPGKVCANHKPNSQSHKDCISRQAKIDQAERERKKATLQKKS